MSSASKVGILAENLLPRPTCGDEPNHRADRHAHSPDARLSAHYSVVTRDARQLWHFGIDSSETSPFVNDRMGSANSRRDRAPLSRDKMPGHACQRPPVSRRTQIIPPPTRNQGKYIRKTFR